MLLHIVLFHFFWLNNIPLYICHILYFFFFFFGLFRAALEHMAVPRLEAELEL